MNLRGSSYRKPFISFAAPLLLVGGLAWVQAEPYIAARTGFKCSQCHVNRTGGGKRTEYGAIYQQYKLMMKTAKPNQAPAPFDTKLNQNVSVGANFRVEQTRRMEYSKDALKVGSSDSPVIREGNLYLQFDLIPDFFTLYLDQTMAASSGNREFWAMISLPGSSYFKFGKMLLPYGLRLMDDDAYIRNKPNYTYNRHDLGYEIGLEPGPLSLTMNVTETQFSSVGSLIFSELPFFNSIRVGASFGKPVQKKDSAFYKNQTYGAFGTVSAGMFTLMAERDWTKTNNTNMVVDFVELNVLPIQGLNFKFTHERQHPNTAIPVENNLMLRNSIGIEPFLFQYFQLGLYYRKNDWIPQNMTANQDEIFFRLHAFM